MAQHVSNFLQSGAQIVLDLINADNAKELPLSAVTFDAPVRMDPEDVENVATSVTIRATTGSGYKGEQTFNYDRVPMSFMNVNEPDLIIETHELSVHALIPFLNTTFGIQLTTDDIVDAPVPVQQPDVNTTLTITAAEGSLVFAGSVDLTLTLPLVDLATLLTVTDLDGLYPPAPVEEVAPEEPAV